MLCTVVYKCESFPSLYIIYLLILQMALIFVLSFFHVFTLNYPPYTYVTEVENSLKEGQTHNVKPFIFLSFFWEAGRGGDTPSYPSLRLFLFSTTEHLFNGEFFSVFSVVKCLLP